MIERSRRESRRQFLGTSSGWAAGSALASAWLPRAFASESNELKVALIGCGGRGTGAAHNALSTAGPTKLWAMADVFENRIKSSVANLEKNHADKLALEDRRYVGFDAYRKAIDSIAPGGVALLCTPPAFRPMHLEYAVERGCHVFMEKSFGVDAPGVRRVIRAGEEAKKKNLKIAGGLMSRHYRPLEEAVAQIHQGAIGDVITCWAYRCHGPVGFSPKPASATEMAHQVRNYSCFTWLNGSFLLDWLIHNLDVCCWVKNAWPVSAQGQGGRQQRTTPDQLFDHYAVEYSFEDGTRLFAQGRHMADCWGFFGDVIHGTKGAAVLGEGITDPKIYRGHRIVPENVIWRYQGPPHNHYQHEHDLLFAAIREDRPYNEAERCAYAALTGILGRMASESGKEITWSEALASNLELAPGIEQFTLDSPPPVVPDEHGKYPIAMPGFTKVL